MLSVPAPKEPAAIDIAPAKREGDLVVLGNYPDYEWLGEAASARRFNIPIETWRGMDKTLQWAANRRFLQRLVARGDRVLLATHIAEVRPGSFFADEIKFLVDECGYVVTDGRVMTPAP